MWELLLQMSLGFSIAISGALIPGPLMAFVTLKTLNYGPKAGPLAATGHILVELGILSLIAFGLGSLQSPLFFQIVGIIGGALLLGMGGIILRRSRGSVKLSQEGIMEKHHPVVGGFLFSTIFNPSVAMWWMTVGLTTLLGAIDTAGVTGGIFWIMGHFLADLSWFSVLSISVDRGREIIGSSFYKALMIACGSILIVFGGYFIMKYLPELVL